jgi:hypothetical protein
MFEEIEKANDGREMILAPQNHPQMFLSFVWDATADHDEAGHAEVETAAPAIADAAE